MKQDNRITASDLIESTVRVIARDGFDKATTRNIAGECGVADSYIYLHFKDKDTLFSTAFQKEDSALVRELGKHLPILKESGISNRDRLCYLFGKMWSHLVAYPDSCRFFVQYYYSPYYPKYSAHEHLKRWSPVLEQMKAIFRSGADVRALLRLALNTMLSQAIKAVDASADKETVAKNNCALVVGMLNDSLLEE